MNYNVLHVNNHGLSREIPLTNDQITKGLSTAQDKEGTPALYNETGIAYTGTLCNNE